MLQESTVTKNFINLDDQLDALESKHTQLETALRKEQKRPQPDDITIQQLKREKLALKDQISELADS
jgi:hypothetical protein